MTRLATMCSLWMLPARYAQAVEDMPTSASSPAGMVCCVQQRHNRKCVMSEPVAYCTLQLTESVSLPLSAHEGCNMCQDTGPDRPAVTPAGLYANPSGSVACALHCSEVTLAQQADKIHICIHIHFVHHQARDQQAVIVHHMLWISGHLIMARRGPLPAA